MYSYVHEPTPDRNTQILLLTDITLYTRNQRTESVLLPAYDCLEFGASVLFTGARVLSIGNGDSFLLICKYSLPFPLCDPFRANRRQ